MPDRVDRQLPVRRGRAPTPRSSPSASEGRSILYARNGAPVVVDVTGWFVASTASADGRFVPITPTRAIDTREPPRSAPLARRRDDQRPAATRCPGRRRRGGAHRHPHRVARPRILHRGPGRNGAAADVDGERRRARADPSGRGDRRRHRRRARRVLVRRRARDRRHHGLVHRRHRAGRQRRPVRPRAGSASPDRHPQRRSDLGRRRRRDRQRRPQRGGAGAQRRDRQPDRPGLPHRPPGASGRGRRRAPSTPPRAARSRRRWRSCPPRRSGSASSRTPAPTWSSISPAGSSARPGRRRCRHRPTSARPIARRPPIRTGLNSYFQRRRGARPEPTTSAPSRLPDGRVPVVLPGRLHPRPAPACRRSPTTPGWSRTARASRCCRPATSPTPTSTCSPTSTQQPQHWFWPLSGDMGADGTVPPVRRRDARERPDLPVVHRADRDMDRGDRPRPRCRSSTGVRRSTRRRRCTGSRSSRPTTTRTCTPTATGSSGGTRSRSSSPPVYVHDWDCADRMTVARVPSGQFDQPLAYWNGSTWGTDAVAGGQRRARPAGS